MYSVLIFGDFSVGIVHDSWFIQPNLVLWPKCTTKILYDHLLKGKLPQESLKACGYTVYRRCDSFPEALSVQQEALEGGHISSSEGGHTKEPGLTKRKRKPKRLPSDFTAESEEDSFDDGTAFAAVVCTPPPPKLLRTTPPVPSCSHHQSRLLDTSSQPRNNTAPCEPSTSATLPAETPLTPFLSTSSPKKDSNTISPDLATLILQNLEKIHSLLLRMALRMEDGCMHTHPGGPERPCLPLTRKEDFDRYEEGLQEPDRYAGLVDTFMAIPATTMEEHVKNILARMVVPSLAVDINWRKVQGRMNFSTTRMAQAIIYTMNHFVAAGRYPAVTTLVLHSMIYRWFDNERGKARKRAQTLNQAVEKLPEDDIL